MLTVVEIVLIFVYCLYILVYRGYYTQGGEVIWFLCLSGKLLTYEILFLAHFVFVFKPMSKVLFMM